MYNTQEALLNVAAVRPGLLGSSNQLLPGSAGAAAGGGSSSSNGSSSGGSSSGEGGGGVLGDTDDPWPILRDLRGVHDSYKAWQPDPTVWCYGGEAERVRMLWGRGEGGGVVVGGWWLRGGVGWLGGGWCWWGKWLGSGPGRACVCACACACGVLRWPMHGRSCDTCGTRSRGPREQVRFRTRVMRNDACLQKSNKITGSRHADSMWVLSLTHALASAWQAPRLASPHLASCYCCCHCATAIVLLLLLLPLPLCRCPLCCPSGSPPASFRRRRCCWPWP